jgi:hypothetical protein
MYAFLFILDDKPSCSDKEPEIEECCEWDDYEHKKIKLELGDWLSSPIPFSDHFQRQWLFYQEATNPLD